MLVVTEKTESRKAYNQLKCQLQGMGEKHVRTLGHPGGHIPNMPVFWSERHAMWSHLNDYTADGRYWICFGRDLGKPSSSLSITVECNPPISAINRLTAGLFLTDGKDLFLGHTGKVGGGKKGVGKSAFLAWYDGGGIETVEWPDGVEADVVVIGRIGSKLFPAQLARFVRQVEAFKAGELLEGTVGAKQSKVLFNPEFSGTSSYTPGQKPIDVKHSHGLVVDALKAIVSPRLTVGNDQQRDLICADAAGKVVALFEIKTVADTTSIYTGVGQLMLHGFSLDASIPRVLVLPDRPTGPLKSAIAALGLLVLTYQVDGHTVEFGRIPRRLTPLFS